MACNLLRGQKVKGHGQAKYCAGEEEALGLATPRGSLGGIQILHLHRHELQIHHFPAGAGPEGGPRAQCSPLTLPPGRQLSFLLGRGSGPRDEGSPLLPLRS